MRKNGNRVCMKRPIAELLTMTINAGAESARAQYEHEAWQILRRKQGYITHRIYQGLEQPLERLVYSEWDSKKALDGARQHLQGTPLMRRGRSALTAAPQRWVVELGGPVTSTKGLEVPSGSIAASVFLWLPSNGQNASGREEKVWKALSAQAGHLATVVFHGFDDPLFLGWLAHWTDAAAYEQARVHFAEIAAGAGLDQPVRGPDCTAYAPLTD